MAYTKFWEMSDWQNENQSHTTPLGATRLNKMNKALDTADDRICELDLNKADATDIEDCFIEVIGGDGILTFKTKSGKSVKVHAPVNVIEDTSRISGVARIENDQNIDIHSMDGKIRISTGSDAGGDIILSSGTGKAKIEKEDGSLVEIADKDSLAKVATSGSYNDLSNKPNIPSAYTLPTANASVLGGVKSATTGTTANRDYNVQVKTDGTMKVNVPWTDTNTTYESKTAASGGTAVSLVTTGEKYTWNNKGTYSKPSGGIPKTDLASAVQSSLTKADNSVPRDYTIKYDDDYGCSFSWKTIPEDDDDNPYGDDGIMVWIPYGSSDSEYAHEFYMDDNDTVLYHRGVHDGSWYRIFDDDYNGNWQTKTTTNTGTITIPTNAKEVYISASFIYSGDYVTFQTNALRSDLVKDKNNRVCLGGYSNGNTDIGAIFVNVSSSGVVSLRLVKYANGNYLSSTTLTVRYRV